MSNYVQKYLFLVLVFATGIAATTEDVLATTQGQAMRNAQNAVNWVLGYNPTSTCHIRDDSPGATESGSYTAINNSSQWCNNEYGAHTFGWDTLCTELPTQHQGVSGTWPDDLVTPPSTCNSWPDFCEYGSNFSQYVPYSEGGGCFSENEVLEDGDTFICVYDYSPTGFFCNVGDGVNDELDSSPGVPSENPMEFNCTNTDCSPNPGPDPPPEEGGGPGGGDPTDSGGSDGGDTGGNSGGGDGDPDTPGDGDGTGSGDIDGDGDRDVDCNPLSNPDCAFAGSATSSAICGTPPTCLGIDPGQCANLYQSYNVMCAILTSAANEKADQEAKSGQASNSCDTPPSCTSINATECVVIRQVWESTCMLIDIDNEVQPGDDPDWDRDLADEGEITEVDIATGLDDSGLGSGSCPAPFGIDANWAQLTFDTAPLCSVAGWVRVFVILFTLLWAAPFVVRSF